MKKLILYLAVLLSFALYAATTDTGTSPQGPPTMGQPTYPNSGFSGTGDKIKNLKTPNGSHDGQRQEEGPSMQGQFDRNGNFIYWDPKKIEEENYE